MNPLTYPASLLCHLFKRAVRCNSQEKPAFIMDHWWHPASCILWYLTKDNLTLPRIEKLSKHKTNPLEASFHSFWSLNTFCYSLYFLKTSHWTIMPSFFWTTIFKAPDLFCPLETKGNIFGLEHLYTTDCSNLQCTSHLVFIFHDTARVSLIFLTHRGIHSTLRMEKTLLPNSCTQRQTEQLNFRANHHGIKNWWWKTWQITNILSREETSN